MNLPEDSCWTILSESRSPHDRKKQLICKCVCGIIKTVDAYLAKTGKSKSCGCKRKNHYTHGYTAKKENQGKLKAEWQAWNHMLQRCTNPNDKFYKDYGARGITVCDRWNNFTNFLEDMGNKPFPGYSLDRYPDNNGNYEPGNCRWASPLQQASNKRNCVYITKDNETFCVAEWSRRTGIKRQTILARLHKGWSVDRILSTDGLVLDGGAVHGTA